MRIAVFHNLPSGGAKRTLYEAMKRLSRNHILDIYTLTTADRGYLNLNEFSNLEHVFHFSPGKLHSSPFGRLNHMQRWLDLQKLDRLSRYIGAKIDEGRYDVVFAQPCMWTTAPLILRHLYTPALYYCHEPPRHLYDSPFRIEDSKSNFSHMLDLVDPLLWLYRTTGRRMDRVAARSAKTILVNSRYTRDRVVQIYKATPVVNYNGVDIDLFKPGARSRSGKYVLSVGAIQPHKGYEFLIESLSQVKREIRPALHLIGNMENYGERDFLISLAKDKGVELHIEVGVEENVLVKRYNDALFVVYAPHNEPFGLVPLEAMACGIPVVGVREGGVMETVLHESTGLLIDRNAGQFAAAIQHMLENPELLEIYGNKGREHVLENWSWEKSISTLTNYLEDCAAVPTLGTREKSKPTQTTYE